VPPAACLAQIDYSVAVCCATQLFACEFTLLFAGSVECMVLVYLSFIDLHNWHVDVDAIAGNES
jgi:hypothetical protein